MTHVGDALSALLDGELTDEEAAEVRAHVADCVECALELDGVRDARRMLRELPAVDPPAGWIDELVSGGKVVALDPRRQRAAMTRIAVSFAAAVLLLVLGASVIGPADQETEVATALERHAATVAELGESTDPSRSGAPDPEDTAALQRAIDRLPEIFDAPRLLATYHLVSVEATPEGGVHLLYRNRQRALSVFESRGGVAFDALPDRGERIEIDGHDAWRSSDGLVVVIEEDDITVTVVSDEPGDAVLEVAVALPSSHTLSVGERMTRAVAKALELFSPLP